jgi:hypothetical protein
MEKQNERRTVMIEQTLFLTDLCGRGTLTATCFAE